MTDPGQRRVWTDGRARAVPIAPDDFCGWLAMATPGDVTVYYRGQLGRDRCRSTEALLEPDRQRLIALARQALRAIEAGRVHLVQRRHGPGDYSYIAIKADQRFRAMKASALSREPAAA